MMQKHWGMKIARPGRAGDSEDLINRLASAGLL